MNYEDVMVVEQANGYETEDGLDYAKSVQRIINAGLWGLQGSFGRTMMAMIEGGQCMLGRQPAHDSYGNRIPSRDEVKPGTKGSAVFVEDAMGADWRTEIEEV